MRAALAAACCAAVWFPGAPARATHRAAPSVSQEEDSVPRLRSAEEQLAHAARLRLEMTRVEGEARARARARAVDAYRAVRRYHGRDAARCAEAAFRAGELLRAEGHAQAAAIEFRVAVTRGARTRFRPRARLELGHIARRAERPERALAHYERVRHERETPADLRDAATLWCARVEARRGARPAARRLYDLLLSAGHSPLVQVDACDDWVSLEVDEGDLEAAAGVLERARVLLLDVSAEETEMGARVRKRLEEMRCVPKLKRAVEERFRRARAPSHGRAPRVARAADLSRSRE